MSRTKIAIIAPEIKSEEDICSYTSMMAYNIVTRLKSHTNIEVVKCVTNEEDLLSVNWNGAKHIFAVGLRYWSTIDNNVAKKLKERISGKLFQYYDSGSRPPHEQIATNFTTMELAMSNRDVYIGWAADSNVFHINKSKTDTTLRILVDHPLFHSGKDMTDEISQQCIALKNSPDLLHMINQQCHTQFENVSCKRLIIGGIEEIDIAKKINNQFVNGKGVNQRTLADEYAKAHIYIVTHGESMGMGVLESALSGCVVLTPKNFIRSYILKKVNHVEFENVINWIAVCNLINPSENRKRVEKYSWENCINKIVEALMQ